MPPQMPTFWPLARASPDNPRGRHSPGRPAWRCRSLLPARERRGPDRLPCSLPCVASQDPSPSRRAPRSRGAVALVTPGRGEGVQGVGRPFLARAHDGGARRARRRSPAHGPSGRAAGRPGERAGGRRRSNGGPRHCGHADGHAAVVMAAGVVLDSHLARDRLDQPDVAQLVQALAELSTLTRVFSSGGGVAGGVCDFRT